MKFLYSDIHIAIEFSLIAHSIRNHRYNTDNITGDIAINKKLGYICELNEKHQPVHIEGDRVADKEGPPKSS